MNLHPSQLPAGTRIPAGMGYATVLPDLDFETYSEAGRVWDADARKWRGPPGAPKGKKGLFVIGAAAYAQHHSTDVLMLAYDLKDGRGPRRWRPGMPLPYDLFEYLAAGGIIEAFNSAFEYWIWNCVCVRRYGFPPVPFWQFRCAQAKARASAYPGSLALAGEVMALQVQKDKAGGDLLDIFSIPRNPTKADPRVRHTLEDFPDDAVRLERYNVIDIISEAEASARCPDLEGEELQFWLLDQLINRRGVAVDVASLRNCAAVVNQCLAACDGELQQITGGVVQRASELEKLKGWLGANGVPMGTGKGSGDDEAIEAAIARVDAMLKQGYTGTLPACRRALELRQLAGSASVKKVFSMLNQVCPDGRLHDLYNYHGARTGRPTGEGPQPTNLPKAGPDVYQCEGCGRWHGAHTHACPWCNRLQRPGSKVHKWNPDAVEDTLAAIASQSLEIVRYYFGDALLAVSGCLRALYWADEGCELVCSDFSSIEGVVTACLAGEDWRVEMFATHSKAYELSVSKITGIPFAEIMKHAGYDDVTSPEWWTKRARKDPHHPMRQTVGKVSELASGFGGGVGAWLRFGAGDFMTEEEIKQAIKKWREASPAIVEFWGGQERRIGWHTVPELFGLEGMAIAAIQNPGYYYDVGKSGITFVMRGRALYCRLPSGRWLTYHNARLQANSRGYGGEHQIVFEGYNTNPTQGPTGWVTMYTYGGKLCENVVQATARDIQRYAMLNLEAAGYSVVLHIYDEDVCEVRLGTGTIEHMESIMGTMPPWAVYKGKPWPIKANGGWRGKRYRKAD